MCFLKMTNPQFSLVSLSGYGAFFFFFFFGILPAGKWQNDLDFQKYNN